MSTAVAKAEPISDGGAQWRLCQGKGRKQSTDRPKQEENNIHTIYINFYLTLKSHILNSPV